MTAIVIPSASPPFPQSRSPATAMATSIASAVPKSERRPGIRGFGTLALAESDIVGVAAIRAMAVRAFAALDCQGLARVDFFVGPDNALTINEVNTMPGFTKISMYPRMWEVTGIDYPTLLSTLVETALARGTGLR